jgi:hypothetical protein
MTFVLKNNLLPLRETRFVIHGDVLSVFVKGTEHKILEFKHLKKCIQQILALEEYNALLYFVDVNSIPGMTFRQLMTFQQCIMNNFSAIQTINRESKNFERTLASLRIVLDLLCATTNPNTETIYVALVEFYEAKHELKSTLQFTLDAFVCDKNQREPQFKSIFMDLVTGKLCSQRFVDLVRYLLVGS